MVGASVWEGFTAEVCAGVKTDGCESNICAGCETGDCGSDVCAGFETGDCGSDVCVGCETAGCFVGEALFSGVVVPSGADSPSKSLFPYEISFFPDTTPALPAVSPFSANTK